MLLVLSPWCTAAIKVMLTITLFILNIRLCLNIISTPHMRHVDHAAGSAKDYFVSINRLKNNPTKNILAIIHTNS